jgi:hypothetical protein
MKRPIVPMALTEQSQWRRYPEVAAFVAERLAQFVAGVPPVQALQAQMILYADNRLADWLDHMVLVDGDVVRGQLIDLGFEPEDVPSAPGDRVYHYPGGLFPWLVLRVQPGTTPGDVIAVAISVGEISPFLVAQREVAPVEGTVLSPYRRASVWRASEREFLVVERRAHRGFVPLEMEPSYAQRYLEAYERWATRPRQFKDVREGMRRTLALARSLVSDFGPDLAAWVFVEAEQSCWQQRNRAGQVQKSRQDRLGLGWANRDHCAFRSSREAFAPLIRILETFGFQPRERFYAGAEAGWGAQVMEHATCRFAIFADVDLAPDEVAGDFAHRPLAPRQELGSIGLWCALHGESVLAAGSHHFASRLDFGAAAEGLAEWGIKLMRPFSDFAYLKQAFTRGERWRVSLERLERLEAGGQISAEQREHFIENGAVGSHLESIQRDEGFKGFNQHTVSDIIRRTDPRAALTGGP